MAYVYSNEDFQMKLICIQIFILKVCTGTKSLYMSLQKYP